MPTPNRRQDSRSHEHPGTETRGAPDGCGGGRLPSIQPRPRTDRTGHFPPHPTVHKMGCTSLRAGNEDCPLLAVAFCNCL